MLASRAFRMTVATVAAALVAPACGSGTTPHADASDAHVDVPADAAGDGVRDLAADTAGDLAGDAGDVAGDGTAPCDGSDCTPIVVLAGGQPSPCGLAI